MLKNYLMIAFRNLRKHKTFSFINITGLSIGMAVSLIMLMYVVDATSFDKYNKNYENIYRIASVWKNGNNPMKLTGSMPAISPALNNNVPEVKAAARLKKIYGQIELKAGNNTIKDSHAFYADNELFKVFTYHFISGDKNSALKKPFSVVLTKDTAHKYFGNKNPINKTLTYGKYELLVTGVIKNIPMNTHIRADLFISYNTIASINGRNKNPWTSWGDTFNYVQLNKGMSVKRLKKRLNLLIKANSGEWFSKNMEMVFQKLSDIHWITDFRGDIGPKDNKTNVYIFLTASIIILLIACFNFVNLSTAGFMERIKEIGVRKVIGANRFEILKQFLIESLLIALLSIIIGVVIFKLVNSSLYSYFGKQIVIGSLHFVFLYIIIIAMIIFVGIIAGSYPAFYLSKFKPADIIRNRISSGKNNFSFRKILVVTQFVMSILLIFGTLVIFKQINFAENVNLGYTKKNVVLLQFDSGKEVAKYNLLKNNLTKYPGITEVAGTFTVAGVNSMETQGISVIRNGIEKNISMQTIAVDYSFIPAMGIQIAKGRDFSKDFSTDAEKSVILNETAVKSLNLSKPIGQQLKIPNNGVLKPVTVIGVVKDYHIQSLRSKIPPLLLYINPQKFNNVIIKYNPKAKQKTIAYIKKIWANTFPLQKLHMTYLEDSYAKLYDSENRTSMLLSLFTFFAIFISALGLFGLASFSISRKVKEIGIRKVFGASVSGLVLNLSKEFTKWILIANLIALPIGYYIMNNWLKNFAYKIEIKPWIFIVSGSAALIIALSTVGIKAYRTATVNPVESLRAE